MSKVANLAVEHPASTMDEETRHRYSQTFTVTQTLERDIIEFLSAKYTANATLSVGEIMALYGCTEDRARRVITNLVKDQVLAVAAKDLYRVVI